MSKKLTPWFPGSVKPVRKGYYERDWNGDGNSWRVAPDYWTGTAWRDAYSVCLMEKVSRSVQNLPWRGLAKAPK
jgi:hypothetical protein